MPDSVTALLGSLLVVAIAVGIAVTIARERKAKAYLGVQGEYQNLVVGTSRGTTEVDRVIVTRHGLFVIEEKDRSGWIFGNENDEQWTAVHRNSKYKFQNPLRQNYAHLKALEELLGIGLEKMHSVVVFRGQAELKTPMPPNVVVNNFWDYAILKTEELLDSEALARINNVLRDVALRSTTLARKMHADSVHSRFSSYTACPKCGGALVERVATVGRFAGQTFLGCTSFPRCRFVKSV